MAELRPEQAPHSAVPGPSGLGSARNGAERTPRTPESSKGEIRLSFLLRFYSMFYIIFGRCIRVSSCLFRFHGDFVSRRGAGGKWGNIARGQYLKKYHYQMFGVSAEVGVTGSSRTHYVDGLNSLARCLKYVLGISALDMYNRGLQYQLVRL